MKNSCRAAALMTAVWLHPVSAALVDFNPSDSLILDPVSVDGVFNFSSIVIKDSVLVSIDRSVWGDQTVSLNALGSIMIYGAFDAGYGAISLVSNDTIYIGGKLYGDLITLDAGAISLVDNPNGSPDRVYTGGDWVALHPDGYLDEVSSGPVERTDAIRLTGAVVRAVDNDVTRMEITPINHVDLPDLVRVNAVNPIEPVLGAFTLENETVQFVEQAVPLPPAALLFGSAVLGLLGWQRKAALSSR